MSEYMFDNMTLCNVMDSPLNPSSHHTGHIALECPVNKCNSDLTDTTKKCCIEYYQCEKHASPPGLGPGSKVKQCHIDSYLNELDSLLQTIDISNPVVL